ncbi:hypothetical protein KA405_01025 [Patescibacteria group bacterium]|nr:hypothetical protein [Patescibacteria group bacterium]
MIQTKTYTLASPERAICDCLYNNLLYPFDSLAIIDRDLLIAIASIYAHYKPQLLDRVLSLQSLHGNTTRYA